MTHRITVRINGAPQELAIQPSDLLLTVLRRDLELMGAREGCGMGACGACTVLVDGRPVSSCLYLALFADGADIVTVEALAGPAGLHPLQAAFLEHGGFQCGFCTPGMLLASKALLDEVPDPTPEAVKDYLAGNLCRCTGYEEIVRAVLAAAPRLREGRGPAVGPAGR